ncbi:MAG: hypothetical protein LBR08_00240 [Bacteroidales bacterium]|jgi:hypothetical protein|nr:hypothetical protein [Bacteroidales bacterium]
MEKIFLIVGICSCTLFGLAQEKETYDILSVSGSITDRKTGKALAIGSKISLQTEIQFGGINDKAILISPAKVKYRLEIPEALFAENRLVFSSHQLLQSVLSRSTPLTAVRGVAAALSAEGVSVKSLRDYLGVDTFSIIGSTLRLPVSKEDNARCKLTLAFDGEGTTDVTKVKLDDFTLSRAALNLADRRTEIKECFVMLDNGKETLPVTRICLIFVDEDRLPKEFAALLSALNIKKANTADNQRLLQQYCLDVYGNIDRKSLNDAIDRFLTSR